MLNCSECLNNLANGNLALLRSGLEAWLQDQELDPAGTLEILQGRICESCKA